MTGAFDGLPVQAVNTTLAPIPNNAVLLFATVRNEAIRLPAFLQYYQSKGVDRFFIVDNASTDDTMEILKGNPAVVPFHTAASYGDAEAGLLWLEPLRKKFGLGHWCLTVDTDELLYFPASEQFSFHDLASYCDRYGYEGLFTLMLDMYPDGPICEAKYEPGSPLPDAFPLFDASGYKSRGKITFPPCSAYGGVRRRVFFASETMASQAPMLHKTPFVRLREGVKYQIATHSTSPIRLADITGVLLHFKFLPDFGDVTAAEARRNDRPFAATHYVRYSQYLRDHAELDLRFEGTVRFADTAQLVELGLMKSSKKYLGELVKILRERPKSRPPIRVGEIWARQNAARETAARLFEPDLRQALQLWDGLTSHYS